MLNTGIQISYMAAFSLTYSKHICMQVWHNEHCHLTVENFIFCLRNAL